VLVALVVVLVVLGTLAVVVVLVVAVVGTDVEGTVVEGTIDVAGAPVLCGALAPAPGIENAVAKTSSATAAANVGRHLESSLTVRSVRVAPPVSPRSQRVPATDP